MPPPPGFAPLPDHHFDGVRLAQIVGVHPVAGGKVLIDEGLRVPALLRRHSAIAGRRRRSGKRSSTAQRLLGFRRQRAEAHAGNGDRYLELDRLSGKSRAQHDVGARTFRDSLRADNARWRRRGTVGRRNAAVCAWRPRRGCHRCRWSPRAGFPTGCSRRRYGSCVAWCVEYWRPWAYPPSPL